MYISLIWAKLAEINVMDGWNSLKTSNDERTFEPILQSVVEQREHIVLGTFVWYRMFAVPLTASELEEVATWINAVIRRLQNASSCTRHRRPHAETNFDILTARSSTAVNVIFSLL